MGAVEADQRLGDARGMDDRGAQLRQIDPRIGKQRILHHHAQV